jgi:hypothetical protein
MSAFLDSFTTNSTPFDSRAAAGVLIPVKGVRGTYSVNYAPGIVPDHVDLADLTREDLEADAKLHSIVTVRIGSILIQAIYRTAFRDVIYRANGNPLAAADVAAALANAVALAQ